MTEAKSYIKEAQSTLGRLKTLHVGISYHNGRKLGRKLDTKTKSGRKPEKGKNTLSYL